MKRLGILGGMGPAASAEFYSRLTDMTNASCDQEHIPCVIWSDPTVPDRSTSLINRDDSPWDKLKQGIIGLKTAGCDHIVIPCNTAHFWYNRLNQFDVPITHIVDSVADELKSRNITHGKIGIIGTLATMRLGLYQEHLRNMGYSCITPSTFEMDALVQPAIDHIKAGNLPIAQNLLMQAINNLLAWNVDAIVLGCTEIPLAIKINSIEKVQIVNSIDSLVKAAIKKYTTPN
jgi:aspartate racemase